MKRILYMLAALALLMATGCKKDEKPVDYKGLLPGEWHCAAVEFGADVYACFEADGDFDLYQMLGEGRYRHYTGNWSIKGDILSGTYSDGAAWGSSYKMSFNGNDSMTLTAQNGSEEVVIYSRESIPSEVKEGCIDVKSSFGMLNSQPQYRWL